MFAEQTMKQGNPSQENSNNNMLRGHHVGVATFEPHHGNLNFPAAGHIIPIRILEEQNQSNNQQMEDHHQHHCQPAETTEMDGSEPGKQEINRIEIPDCFKKLDEDFKSKKRGGSSTNVSKPPSLVQPEKVTDPGQFHHHQQQQQQPGQQQPGPTNHISGIGINQFRRIPIIVEGIQQQMPQQHLNHQQQYPETHILQNQHKVPSKPDPLVLSSQTLPELGNFPTENSDNKPPTPPPRSPKNKNIINRFTQKDLKSTRFVAEPPASPMYHSPPSSSYEEPPAPPPVKKPTPDCTQLGKVEAISQDVQELQKQVTELQGWEKSKEYLYLDEMLTRCLIKLDNIETEGREDVRNARKDCIKLIQKCISDLEAKLRPDEAPQQQQAPATSQGNTTSTTSTTSGIRKFLSKPLFGRNQFGKEPSSGDKKSSMDQAADASKIMVS